jgi:hypothetical protein
VPAPPPPAPTRVHRIVRERTGGTEAPAAVNGFSTRGERALAKAARANQDANQD